MLKFFRSIRRKLIDGGSLKKYIIYAIGEILLVMIGILLALQVNNWNEYAKLRLAEKSVLIEIKRDLDQNILQLKNILETDSIIISVSENLIGILKDEHSIYHDSLASSFGWIGAYSPFYAKDGAYENLKQKGIDLIQNDSLKQVLVELFETSLPRQEQGGNSFERDVSNRRYDMTLTHFETGSSVFSKRPNNFIELKENQEFMNFLTWARGAKSLIIVLRKNCLTNTIQVKKILEKYLEEFE
jgi:hypothetical protein